MFGSEKAPTPAKLQVCTGERFFPRLIYTGLVP
jgi:hypothetical protein